MSNETATTETLPAEAPAAAPEPAPVPAPEPAAAPMNEAQVLAEKGSIDTAFSNAAPAPDFKEPEARQENLLPPETAKRKITKMTMELPVKFSDEQLIREGDILAGMLEDMEEIEDEKAVAMKDFKNKIDLLYTQIQEQRKVVQAKGSKKLIQCEEVIDYVAGLAITIRLDTNEEVKRRPLERAELQQELALVSRQESKRNNVINGKFGAGPWNNPAYGQNAKPGDTLLDTGISAGAVAEALMKLEGVTSVEVYENEKDEEDEDKRPPKCVEIMIDGGDGMAIAKKIVELLPIKVRLHGNTVVNVERENDFTVQVLFSRPGVDAQPLELKPEVEGAAAEAGEGSGAPAPEADDGGIAKAPEGELNTTAAADLESEHNDAMDAHDASEALEAEAKDMGDDGEGGISGDGLGDIETDAAAGQDGDGF